MDLDLSGLNPPQLEAVSHGHGPLLVLAGAGSGKTRVITYRLARLLSSGVPAENLLAVTFTNKAAAEMRERVESIVGRARAKGMVISTFHSLGLQFLQREARYLGFGGGFTVFDQADCMGVVKEIFRGMNVDGGRRLDAAAVLGRISVAKNNFETPETMPDGGDLDGDTALYQQVAKIIFEKYLTALKGFHALDFDDLICEPVRILKQFAEVRERWQRRVRYLLVDEYQDTNHAQLELLRLLAGDSRNLTVVGDDDQSIYGWRGADIRNILSFDAHFPGAKIVKLEENYRSRTPILDSANAVIAHADGGQKKYRKELFTKKIGGDLIELLVCASPEAEASFIAAKISDLVSKGTPASEIAIMYRSNKLAEAFETALRERSVGCQVYGGQAFFERKEVKDLLAYLKLVALSNDEIALRRILNYPSRGIGDGALGKLEAYALAKGVSLFVAVSRASEVAGLTSVARAGCEQLSSLIVEAKSMLLQTPSPSKVARFLADAIGLKNDIIAAGPTGTASAKRWGNVENLYRSLERYEKSAEDMAYSLSGERPPTLLEQISRMLIKFSETEDEPQNVVTLTTLHGAKGLEYDVVFLVGLEEGILPHSRSIDPRSTDVVEFKTDPDGTVKIVDPAGVDEERRLFYVGITRAKEKLFLSRCRTRSARGKEVERIPTRFLADIPRELTIKTEVEDLVPLTQQQQKKRFDAAFTKIGGKPKFD